MPDPRFAEYEEGLPGALARLNTDTRQRGQVIGVMKNDVRAALAEIDRLREENVELRDMVRSFDDRFVVAKQQFDARREALTAPSEEVRDA